MATVCLRSLGQISTEEELTLLTRHMHEASGADEEELREAFRISDQDQSGFISHDEIRHVLQNLGERLSGLKHCHLNSTCSSSLTAEAAESGSAAC